jgi:2-iminobutanoate/2-iminopropanoate deaminase
LIYEESKTEEIHLNKFVFIFMALAILISLGEPETYLNATNRNKTIIFTENAPKVIGPYSQAVQYGGLLFISGQIGIDPISGDLSTSVGNQTRQVMENLKAILTQANMSFDDVVQTRIYLKEIGDFQKVNEIYAGYFEKNYPARSTLQAAALPRNAQVEIEMIAIRA